MYTYWSAQTQDTVNSLQSDNGLTDVNKSSHCNITHYCYITPVTIWMHKKVFSDRVEFTKWVKTKLLYP